MLSVGFAALAFSGMAAAATFTIPSGVTNTIDEAIASGYLSGVSDYTGLCAAVDLIVAGGGQLTIDKDLRTAGFAGEVHVQPGATLALAVKGSLGDTEHGTFVADGATLATLPGEVQNSLDFKDEPLSFAGVGVDGMGALQVRTKSTSGAQRLGCWGGTALTMTGDATVGVLGGGKVMFDFPCNSSENVLDMNGHTLTFVGDTAEEYTLPVRFKVKNPGHIVVSNRVNLSMNELVDLGGSAANTIKIGTGSRIDLYYSTVLDAKKWTLILDTEVDNALSSTAGGAKWDGPVERTNGGCTRVRLASESTTSVPTLLLRSTFTTTSRVDVVNSTATGKGYTQPVFALGAAANVLPEGLTVTDASLRLDSATAIPPTGGPLVLKDAPLVLADGNSDLWQFPSTTIDNALDQSLTTGLINWFGTFTKKGSGVLTISAASTFEDIRLQTGALTLQGRTAPDRHWNAGLWKGTNQAYTAWASGTCPANGEMGFAGRICWTNEVAFGPDLAMRGSMYDYKKLTVATYRGYIRNETADSCRVLTLLYGASDLCQIFVWNGSQWETFGRQGLKDSVKEGIQLGPGYWPIEIRLVDMQSPCSFGPNGKIDSDYGIMYSWGDSTNTSMDPHDYQPLMDLGDGSLLTLTAPDTDEYWALKAKCETPVKLADSIVADAETTFTLVGGNYKVSTLSGAGTVVNVPLEYDTLAGLTVSDVLAVRADDLSSGNSLCVNGRLTFAAGAKVTVDGKASNGTYTLVSSTEEISGCPTIDDALASRCTLRLSADGKSLLMDMCKGLIILVK